MAGRSEWLGEMVNNYINVDSTLAHYQVTRPVFPFSLVRQNSKDVDICLPLSSSSSSSYVAAAFPVTAEV